VVIDVMLPDTAFVLETDRGVFSRGHVDTGTNLLLRADLPLASTGHLLDLGAGAGPIALAMARRSPEATVWAVDVNSRARDLCMRNAMESPMCRWRHPPTCLQRSASRRSGRIHRSASANPQCERSSWTGLPGSMMAGPPAWSCRNTSVLTRCNVGCRAKVFRPTGLPRRAAFVCSPSPRQWRVESAGLSALTDLSPSASDGTQDN
jgi:hypothetical protein